MKSRQFKSSWWSFLREATEFINNEAENLGKALFVGGFFLLIFFHFLEETT